MDGHTFRPFSLRSQAGLPTRRSSFLTDGGLTWRAAGAGLPNVPIQKLLAAPNDLSGNTVYAATWLGVYRTTDGGATWSQFGAGLPTVEVSDLCMPADGSFLRASTYGRGVWDLQLR